MIDNSIINDTLIINFFVALQQIYEKSTRYRADKSDFLTMTVTETYHYPHCNNLK